jgi:acetyl/propionyl-CoA carboxylase alpha subunit
VHTRRTITKLLIANRGEIARRVMRTCREMGIRTVAVFSDVDRDAPFVAEADEAVRLGGTSAASSYLRADAIVAAAERTGAGAVHPGYGFLAEDASFAERCGAADLIFVGPPPAVLRAMGSKLEAKRIAASAGVPVLPAVEVVGEGPQRIAAVAREMGFPLLVKASAGGGGRGMRLVRHEGELAPAIDSARREAEAGFGDDTVFLEPWIEAPRHVEVQILGDVQGRVVHLFERECSIQRRHQKIVEESPSPAVDDDLRARLGAAAVQLGEAVGYVGAGTVEFLLAGDGRFHFLEVNARLQVEHPVTEALTGLDLVRVQIEVAQGMPLDERVRSAERLGHAIEVRLCAEDPTASFAPTTGTVHRWRVPELPGLRVDSGIVEGSVVTPYYDSMLAKLIVHAPTRSEAAHRLALALGRLSLDGIRTNQDLLRGILLSEEFLRGATDTGFLERHPPEALVFACIDPMAHRLHALAAALHRQAERRAQARILKTIPSGWRNVPSAWQEATFEVAEERIDVAYRFTRAGLDTKVSGEVLGPAQARVRGDGFVDLEVAGVVRAIEVSWRADTCFARSSLGRSELQEIPRFPLADIAQEQGSLRAPMPGTVVRVSVSSGESVGVGQELVVIEAMKMEHRIVAPRVGRVRAVCVSAGGTVAAGEILVIIDEGTEEAVHG